MTNPLIVHTLNGTVRLYWSIQMPTKQLNLRVPDIELQLLERYCKGRKRTKTDVIREFIRSLQDK